MKFKGKVKKMQNIPALGAEIRDLIGCLFFTILSLQKMLVVSFYGLYRDGGLDVCNKSKCEQKRISNKIREVFKSYRFKINIKKDRFPGRLYLFKN